MEAPPSNTSGPVLWNGKLSTFALNNGLNKDRTAPTNQRDPLGVHLLGRQTILRFAASLIDKWCAAPLWLSLSCFGPDRVG